MRRLVRSPNLVAYWRGGGLCVEEFVRGIRIRVSPPVLQLLDRFAEPRSTRVAIRGLRGFRLGVVGPAVRQLVRWGFLLPAASRRSSPDVAARWRGSFAAAHFHFATRDPAFVLQPEDEARVLGERLAAAPSPPVHKQYPRRSCTRLPPGARGGGMTLDRALRLRRTVRAFTSRPVPLSTFGGIVRGTWGQTGWLDAGVLGQLVLKTSPSAGARHPIECYVLAWRVSGLAPGLYHFDVRDHGLERLRRGDLRGLAVAMAGGQAWVEQAAFLCVMTAVADRVFWKYSSADAYRLFLLDAGHLAQTFALLSTAAGLGAFTTAAMSEKRIERALGLDGVAEFPVYLCGAGWGASAGARPASSGRRAGTATAPPRPGG